MQHLARFICFAIGHDWVEARCTVERHATVHYWRCWRCEARRELIFPTARP